MENKTVYSRIYLIMDSHGNKAYATCEEGADGVQICGLLDKNYERAYFESEAYHLDVWCEEIGATKKVIYREEDFDTLWKQATPEK